MYSQKNKQKQITGRIFINVIIVTNQGQKCITTSQDHVSLDRMVVLLCGVVPTMPSPSTPSKQLRGSYVDCEGGSVFLLQTYKNTYIFFKTL